MDWSVFIPGIGVALGGFIGARWLRRRQRRALSTGRPLKVICSQRVAFAGRTGRWRNGYLRVHNGRVEWRPWAFTVRRGGLAVPLAEMSIAWTRRLTRVEGLLINSTGRVLVMRRFEQTWELAIAPWDLAMVSSLVGPEHDRRWRLLVRLLPLFRSGRSEPEDAIQRGFAEFGLEPPPGYVDFLTTIGSGLFHVDDLGFSVWPASRVRENVGGLPPRVLAIGMVGSAGGRVRWPEPDGLLALDLRGQEPLLLEVPVPADITRKQDLHCRDLPDYVHGLIRRAERLMLWRAVRGSAEVREVAARFDSLPLVYKRETLLVLAKALVSSGWLEADTERAAQESPSSTFDAVTAKAFADALLLDPDRIPSSTRELGDVFELMMHILEIVDGRHRESLCGGSCEHWWHGDVDQPNLLRTLTYTADNDTAQSASW